MNPRARLLALAALFLAPIVAAVVVFFVFPESWPSGKLNHGRLIDPARPMPPRELVDASGQPAPVALREKWSVVYLGGERCDDPCAEQLRLVRQVRLRLSEKGVRVQYVYIAPDIAALGRAHAALAAEHPAMMFLADTGARGARAADFFEARDPDALYLLDPLANWLMVYEGPVNPKDLLDDLKKLLRFSHIG
jgi:hypothetical protein